MFKPALKMVDVESIGSYAVRITWSDGHNTGIYPFDHFRRICPAKIAAPPTLLNRDCEGADHSSRNRAFRS